MQYCRASLVKTAEYHYLIVINGNNGTYHELPALDSYSAEQILFDFCSLNSFILTEKTGFSIRGRASAAGGGDFTSRAAAPIADARARRAAI